MKVHGAIHDTSSACRRQTEWLQWLNTGSELLALISISFIQPLLLAQLYDKHSDISSLPTLPWNPMIAVCMFVMYLRSSGLFFLSLWFWASLVFSCVFFLFYYCYNILYFISILNGSYLNPRVLLSLLGCGEMSKWLCRTWLPLGVKPQQLLPANQQGASETGCYKWLSTGALKRLTLRGR